MPRAFVFDPYGTLFDVHAAIARHREAAGPDAVHGRARAVPGSKSLLPIAPVPASVRQEFW